MTNKSVYLSNDLVNEKRDGAQNSRSENSHGVCVLGIHSADLAMLVILIITI